MMRNLLLLGLTLVFTAGCADEDHPTGIADEQFIEIVVSLRQASNVSGGDSIAFAAERDRILLEHGVTEDELGQYVNAHAADLDHFARIWDAVNERLQLEGPR